jgi:putative inorganic carbon (hco3(-)) transporter
LADGVRPFVTATSGGLAIIAAAMPLYVVRFRIGPIPTTVLEVLILATLAAYILGVALGQTPRPQRTGFEVPVALFLLAGVVGILVAPDHRAALGIFRAYLVEPIALFYVASAVLDLDRKMNALLVVAGAGALIFALLEIFVVLQSVARGLGVGYLASALDINTNSVALYLEPFVAFSAAFALFARGRIRLLALGLLLVFVVALVASLSRGGFVTIGVLGLIALVSVRSWVARLVVAAAGVLGSVAAWQVTALRLRIIYLLTDQQNGPVFNRPVIWADTLRMLRDHPVFGAGISGYQTVMTHYRASGRYNVPEPYAHNIFLSTWSELGLLGLAAFVWILSRLAVQPWRALSHATGVQVPLLWGTGTAFAMLAVHGLVDTPYWKNDLSVEFWLLAVIQVVALRSTAQANRP